LAAGVSVGRHIWTNRRPAPLRMNLRQLIRALRGHRFRYAGILLGQRARALRIVRQSPKPLTGRDSAGKCPLPTRLLANRTGTPSARGEPGCWGALQTVARSPAFYLTAGLASRRAAPGVAFLKLRDRLGTLLGAPSRKSTRACRGPFAYQPSGVPSEPTGIPAVACSNRTRSPGLRLVVRLVLPRFVRREVDSGGPPRKVRN
jgi:hypothetical protein